MVPAKLQAYAPFSRMDQVEPEEDVDEEANKNFLPEGQEDAKPSGAGGMGADTSRLSLPNASPAPSPRSSDAEAPGPLPTSSIGTWPSIGANRSGRRSQTTEHRRSHSRSSSVSRSSISSDTGRSEWRPGGRLQTDARVILQLMRRVEWLSVMKETMDKVGMM